MGGTIAQLLILREPSLISHAVLVGAFPPGAQPITFSQLFIETAQKATYTEDDCKIAPNIDPLSL
jgi:pimeloyl-ACP methyl ester carboxylesterase